MKIRPFQYKTNIYYILCYVRMSCNQPGQIVIFTKCLLFTVGMVVRSAQSRLRTDHGEDHPLLHRDTFRRESSLLQAGNHGETVLTFPRENGAGEDKTEDDQDWCEVHRGDDTRGGPGGH